MCCFRLHFSDFNVLFKKIKNLLQFNFEKNNLLCNKREKITQDFSFKFVSFLCIIARE